MIEAAMKELIEYGKKTGLLKTQEDCIYATNRMLEILKLDSFDESAIGTNNMETTERKLQDILDEICDYAAEHDLIQDNSVVFRDLFDTKLMDCMMPRPSEVTNEFFRLYEKSPMEATDYYYKLSQDSNYIRRDRISRDIHWSIPSEYGTIDLSINLSKPEKDPKAIAAARNTVQTGYPKCLLCKENIGFAGTLSSPARQNHRIIPLDIAGNRWGLQYSPYVYYNEHCILFNYEHIPMKIERRTFEKLLGFIEKFPHYFIGSNADLPIVGGSILSHDHYQGGRYTFAMEKAEYEWKFKIKGYEDVEAGVVKWPLTVIRISHEDKNKVIDLADHILNQWRAYSDPDAFIFANTDGVQHNTITPIARMRDGKYELDLVLRNNITTEEHPLGVYHPHQEYHHIKKENIGLIEVMGLAILPARLEKELQLLGEYIVAQKDIRSNEILEKHADWVEEFRSKYSSITKENVMDILKKETGEVFVHVLEDAGVYKCTPEGRTSLKRFLDRL